MVVVNSDIYPVVPMGTEFADIVLPAAAWGEHDAARNNGERRLRLYSKFYDAPGCWLCYSFVHWGGRKRCLIACVSPHLLRPPWACS